MFSERQYFNMGVKDTNAATAMDGILRPVDDHDQLDPQARNVPMERVEKVPKVRDKKVAKPSSQNSEAMFRPRQRAAIPQLLVLDDSQRSAETIRIRKSPFRIGRQEGDLIIPLDSQLSASHAEIFFKGG